MQLMSQGRDPSQWYQRPSPAERRCEKDVREADWSENELVRSITILPISNFWCVPYWVTLRLFYLFTIDSGN